ncbi:MAG TPA: ankyrin repeat domain-containing protein [Pyrinomonadaceae bacterium]|nr:ankyrin repeat domain-containing protein [Pyrinomonadaceae bacterium]
MAQHDEFIKAVKQDDGPAVAELLHRHPELIRVADEYDKTGLHWAAEKDHVEIARLLLDAGADIEAKTSWGDTPLKWAATLGNSKVADLLLSRGARGFDLIIAAALGKLEDVKTMIGSDPDPSAVSNALYSAARNGHTEVVRYLLEHGAAVDTRGFFGGTGLHWAAINGHRETVELLIARGANLELRDEQFKSTPEGWAMEGGHTEIVDLLRAQDFLSD